MKEVTVGDQKVLLVRSEGQYSAVGGRCSHYGAPLIKGKALSYVSAIYLSHFLSCMLSVNSGTLVGDRVRCPFHGACFNVRNGDIEEYPGLDSLPCYKVKWHLFELCHFCYHKFIQNCFLCHDSGFLLSHFLYCEIFSVGFF